MSEQSDILFLSSPGQWPCYPLCPVKHSDRTKEGGFPVLGFVMAAKPTVVWLENMIKVWNREVDLDAIESQSYESIEDLVADGWIVD